MAASILTAAYHMLKDGTAYRDLGPDHFDRRAKEVQARRLVRRLADLGYAVELAPLEPAPTKNRFLPSRPGRGQLPWPPAPGWLILTPIPGTGKGGSARMRRMILGAALAALASGGLHAARADAPP